MLNSQKYNILRTWSLLMLLFFCHLLLISSIEIDGPRSDNDNLFCYVSDRPDAHDVAGNDQDEDDQLHKGALFANSFSQSMDIAADDEFLAGAYVFQFMVNGRISSETTGYYSKIEVHESGSRSPPHIS